jgi:hypothetical protein
MLFVSIIHALEERGVMEQLNAQMEKTNFGVIMVVVSSLTLSLIVKIIAQHMIKLKKINLYLSFQ